MVLIRLHCVYLEPKHLQTTCTRILTRPSALLEVYIHSDDLETSLLQVT